MASEEFGDKTHEATPYRRQKAREEGQVVRSQDLASAGLLVAALLVLSYFGGSVAQFLGSLASDHLGGEAWLSIDQQTFVSETVQLAWRLGLVLVPILGLLALAAVISQMGQFGFVYVPQKLALDWQRLNPLSNGQRIFSMSN